KERESAPAAASSPTHASSSSGGEKTEAELAREAELEEKKAAAARVLEELTGIMHELHRASLDAAENFLSNLRAPAWSNGFIVLDSVSTSSQIVLRNAAVYARKVAASFAAFLQAQHSLFQQCWELSAADSNKLVKNGMK